MISWITENYTSILAALGAVYSAATVVAAITPSDKDDTFLEKIGSYADRIGLKIKGK